MYIGNSRMLLGKNTNEKMLGDWLAVAPSTASSGTYGINNASGGFCSEIFNGYLYVGGEFTEIINNTNTTSTPNNLIKYKLQDNTNGWENALTTNIQAIQSMRSIGNGDDLLLGANDGLYYLDDTTDTTPTEISPSEDLGSISGISNVFTSININGTTHSHTSNNYMCIVGEVFGPPRVYNGSNRTVSAGLTSSNVFMVDSYVTSNTSGKILGIDVAGSFLAKSTGFTDYNTNYPNASPQQSDGEYFQCMTSIPAYPNIIYIATAVGGNIYVFNHSQETYSPPIELGVGIDPITLNTVVYKNINYLIVGGRYGMRIVNPEDTSVVKDVPFPFTGNNKTIRSISVDSDSTIYVTGSFQFTDKNGVTAKNIAKFVPDPSKLP
jgi:hypothetical protein